MPKLWKDTNHNINKLSCFAARQEGGHEMRTDKISEKNWKRNKLFLPEEINSKKPNQICVSQKSKYEDSNKI